MITICGDGTGNPLGWMVADINDISKSRATVMNLDIDIIAFCTSAAKAERVRAALIAMDAMIASEGKA